MLKKVLKITGITLGALLLILFIAPYIFKGKINRIVKEQINKNINAKVDFSDLSLSFFRHFPKVSVALEDLQLIGLDQFSKDTLISAKEIDVAVNLFSVMNAKDMKIYSIKVDGPRIHAIITKDGKANWDISKPDTSNSTPSTPEEASPFKLNLEKYSIKNGYIKYDDASGNMSCEIFNLDHNGSGDFTSDLFTLATQTNAEAVSFNYGGIPYLVNTKTAINADIQVDNKTSKYSFKTDEITVNALKVSTEGFFQLVNDSTYNMDISFKAPSTEFKDILSLVPAVYQQDFAKIKTSGKAAFNGFVKGTYSGSKIPAYNINLSIENGSFQYPDLPKAVKNINLALQVSNPDGVTDNTVVDIPKAHIEFDNDPFDFRLLLKKPLTEQYIDAAANGKLDLGSITQFVKLEPGTKLAGTLNADIQAKGSLAVIRKQKPGEFSAKGFLEINNLYYSSKSFPEPIQHTSAKINIDNPDGVADHTSIQIPAAHVEIGSDVADLTLMLKTPASDPDFNGTAKGSFNLAHVAQFYQFEPGTSLTGALNADLSFKGKKSFIDKGNYDAVQTSGAVKLSGISYKSKDYPDGVNIQAGQLTFNPKNLAINNIDGKFMGTNFNVTGEFDNLVGYAMKNEPLAGTLNLVADQVDLNKLMGSSTGTTTASTTVSKDSSAASTGPFLVPKNIQFTLNSKVKSVKYDKVEYSNINGSLLVKDETVTLKNVQMQALDGTIVLNGYYSTRDDKKKPAISLSYDVQNLDVQKTFFAYNTVQKLMPIGKFISGKLNSKMNMKGKLGGDMMPDLASLTGDGTLDLLQGVLSKFQPAEKLATTLNLTDLHDVTLKDIKNSFEFANGKVLVKPFDVKVKDIDMQIGGMHGLDQSLDYVINMKVPRAKMGSTANQFINNLAQQATNKGVAVKVSDVINLKVNVGGTILNPTIKPGLAGAGNSIAQDMKQQANEFVEAKKAVADSMANAAKAAAKDTMQSMKKQVLSAAGDELKNQLSGKKDTTAGSTKDPKKGMEESAKGLLNNFLKKKKPADSTKQ